MFIELLQVFSHLTFDLPVPFIIVIELQSPWLPMLRYVKSAIIVSP